MCTAITYSSKEHFFGRNLDLEFSYNEAVTITPRNFSFSFRKAGAMKSHFAMIGMAIVVDDFPLYYDATNEMGLSMAGLNFPGNADYKPEASGFDNITPFEFIPWVLGQCSTISDVRTLLSKINLVNINFSDKFPLSPLHWIIADKNESITVESVKDCLKIYDNPVGVLTNNPTFDYHITNLSNYMGLSNRNPANSFSEDINLTAYSRGMGALGLPGDLSSASRFVKATFTKLNSVAGDSEVESISQFFHILGSVEQQRGCVIVGDAYDYEITFYSSCCNVDKGIYYYKTYDNSQISGVNMWNEDLDSDSLVTYGLIKTQQLKMQN